MSETDNHNGRIEQEVTKSGNGGHVYVPKDWIGETVTVTLNQANKPQTPTEAIAETDGIHNNIIVKMTNGDVYNVEFIARDDEQSHAYARRNLDIDDDGYVIDDDLSLKEDQIESINSDKTTPGNRLLDWSPNEQEIKDDYNRVTIHHDKNDDPHELLTQAWKSWNSN